MNHKRTIPRTCLTCGKDFLAARGEVNRGYGNYCSRSCARWKGGPILRICQTCGKDFLAEKRVIKRGWGRFCSPGCSAKSQMGEANPNWKGGITPLQIKTRNAVYRAIKNGKLVPGPCELCGSTRFVDGHHDDYAKPLDVRWLCRSCHKKEHAQQ